MRKWIPYIILIAVFVFFYTNSADAQCVQCKLLAGAAETVDDKVLDYHQGNNINSAILYIMLAPYVLFGLAVLFLRKRLAKLYRSVFVRED